MFGIPRQPRPLLQPAVQATLVRLQARTPTTISPFTGPWLPEHLKCLEVFTQCPFTLTIPTVISLPFYLDRGNGCICKGDREEEEIYSHLETQTTGMALV